MTSYTLYIFILIYQYVNMSISPTLCTHLEVRKRKVGHLKFKAPQIMSGVLKWKNFIKYKIKYWMLKDSTENFNRIQLSMCTWRPLKYISDSMKFQLVMYLIILHQMAVQHLLMKCVIICLSTIYLEFWYLV